MNEFDEAFAWHRAGQGTAPTARSVRYVEAIIRFYERQLRMVKMPRIDLSLVLDPVSDLTLAEKFACAKTYGNEWFDDLDMTVRAARDLNLGFMRPESTVTECPIPNTTFSVYLFHHA